MKIVVGQGSCGIATGAKKVANRFEEILGEKNIDINVDITGCIGTCFLEPIVDIYEDGKDEPTRFNFYISCWFIFSIFVYIHHWL